MAGQKRAKHGKTSFTDTESVSIVKLIMAKHKGVAAQLNDHDTWPNIDGQIEILDPESRPIGLISAQVKKLPADHGHKFDCPTELFDYVIETDPILLLCVDTEKEVVYWQYYDKDAVKKLNYGNEQKMVRVSFDDEHSFSREKDSYIEQWRQIVKDRRAKQEGLEDTIAGHIQERIDVSKQLLNKHRYTEAYEYLEGLKTSFWNEADDLARFRILANTAVAQLHTDRQDEAAENFLKANKIKPDAPASLGYTGSAYLIKGEWAKALKVANSILRDNPLDTQSAIIKVQAMRNLGKSYSAILKTLDKKVVEDHDVANILAITAADAGDNVNAEKWFQVAATDTNDPIILSSYGSYLLQQLINDQPLAMKGMLSRKQQEQIRKGVEVLDKAWAETPDPRDRTFKTEWLFNIMIGYRFLGDERTAESKIEELLELKPDSDLYIKNAAIVAMEAGKFDMAEQLLKKRLKVGSELAELGIMLAELYITQGRDEEALRQATVFLKSHKEHDALWFDAKQDLFEVNMRLGKIDAATKIAQELSQNETSKAYGLLFFAKLARTTQDTEKAISLLDEVEQSLPSEADKKLLVDIAMEAYGLGSYRLAADLLEKTIAPNVNNSLVRRYLHSLFESRQYGKAINVAATIRQANGMTRDITQFEWAAYLELQNLTKARQILGLYVGENPDDESAMLSIALIDLRRGNVKAVDEYLAREIDLTKLEFHSEIQLANLYEMRENAKRTLELLYDARRRHINEPDAHSAYITLFLGLGESIDKYLHPDKVEPNTVLIYDGGYFIIESDYTPRVSENEISAKDAEERNFISKKVGDTIELTRNQFAGAREVKIKEIKSKYLFALHDSMQNYERRFPDRTDLMSFSIEDGIDPVFKTLDQARTQGDKTEQLYKNGKITIDLFAKFVGKNLIDVFYALRSTPDLGIRMSRGVQQEIDAVHVMLQSGNKSVVADITALITFYGLGIKPSEVGLPKFLISQTTLDLIMQRIVKENTFGQKEKMTLYKQNGKYIRQEITADQQVTNLRHLSELEKWVRANTKTTPIEQAQYDAIVDRSTDPTKLDDLFSEAQLDSLRLASAPDRILYSDDFAFRSLADTTFGVPGVWTQVLLEDLLQKGTIDNHQYNGYSIKLALANYHYLAINSDILLSASEQAKWFPGEPLTQVIKSLARAETTVQSLIVVLTNFLYALYKKPIMPDRRHILDHVLDEVAHHHDMPQLLELLKHGVRVRFKLTPIQQMEIINSIDAWGKIHGYMERAS